MILVAIHRLKIALGSIQHAMSLTAGIKSRGVRTSEGSRRKLFLARKVAEV